MESLLLLCVVLGILLVLISTMAVLSMLLGRPIKHCGSSRGTDGSTIECSICGDDETACTENQPPA